MTSRELAQLPELAFNPFVLRVAEVIEDESDSPDLCQGEMDARMFLLLLSVFHHATPDREKMQCTSTLFGAAPRRAAPAAPRRAAVRSPLTCSRPARALLAASLILCAGAFKCFDYDRDGVLSRDDLVEAFSLIHSTVPVAEIELKVELVMEAAGKDENLGPADFEALMEPYSFQRLFTINY